MPSFWFTFSLFILISIFFSSSQTIEDDIKLSLIDFLQNLSGNNSDEVAKSFGWTVSTDPCTDGWNGVSCNTQTGALRKIILEGKGFNGTIDARSLCKATRLAVVSLHHNELQGTLSPEISDCKQLTHLLINGNKLSGSLPSSLSGLNNLKRLDISNNIFSGELPDLPSISGLKTFLAQDNKLSGSIPQLDFKNLDEFNISNNLFTGNIPQDATKFGSGSLSGNPGLCGEPLKKLCQETLSEKKSKKISGEKLAMIIGYALLGFLVILLLAFMIYRKRKKNSVKPINASTTSELLEQRSPYSIGNDSNTESPVITSDLVVLKSGAIPELSFENLLKAPAELLAKSKVGSTYKVVLEEGRSTFVVKRVKDLKMSGKDFSRRMTRIDKGKHESVLPAVAFYCSKQEKLVLYEYQQNGSIFNLLQGSGGGGEHRPLTGWNKRLDIAARVANCLAFMHKELDDIELGHGNLKSTNILLDNNMNPLISEYGLSVQCETKSSFMDDVFNLGVILLELLTGRVVQNNGSELAQWVQSVVKEEWTVEVFDKVLTGEKASEEAMVSLLQVALLCIMNSCIDTRPSMAAVASMINALREEEEDRSIVSEV